MFWGPVRFSYNLYFSASFFSRNSVFLSKKSAEIMFWLVFSTKRTGHVLVSCLDLDLLLWIIYVHLNSLSKRRWPLHNSHPQIPNLFCTYAIGTRIISSSLIYWACILWSRYCQAFGTTILHARKLSTSPWWRLLGYNKWHSVVSVQKDWYWLVSIFRSYFVLIGAIHYLRRELYGT